MANDASLEAGSSQAAGDSPESAFKINVKTLDSQTHTFCANKNMPVHMLKEKIAEATGVPVGQQRLIFRGRVLKDDHVLSEYHLGDGHTLHLVVRQPSQLQPAPGASSQGITQGNGNDTTVGASRPRGGQVAHSVVLGTVNVADQGQNIVADIGRLVGAVLSSFGVGGSNISAATVTNPNAGTEGTEPVGNGNRTQAANLGQPGLAISSNLSQLFPQLSPSPLPVPLPHHTVIPDSLTTLSEFVRHMERVLHNGGGQSSPSSSPDPPRSDIPLLNSWGLPTVEGLGSVIERVQQLLSVNAATALAHFATQLEREGLSAEPVVRSQVQNEAMRLGTAMHHLGAMIMELGRTMIMLRMGQSPAESFVNGGPAVYISPTGPNPIMVQPFPLQTSSLFGVSPNGSGFPGSLVAGDPSRNVNIHIHAGTSVTPGVSSTGTRVSSGETTHGERSHVRQQSTNANASVDSAVTGALPSRTIVAAIPAQPAAGGTSHVLNVVYPVHARSQQTVSSHSDSHVQQSIGSNGTISSIPSSIMQPSSESDAILTIAAQTNVLVGALASNAQAQTLSIPSMQSIDSHVSNPIMVHGTQPTNPLSQSTSESDPVGCPALQANGQTASSSSGDVHDESPSLGGLSTDLSDAKELGQVSVGSVASILNGKPSDFSAEGGDDSQAFESRSEHTNVSGVLMGEAKPTQSEGTQDSDKMISRSLELDSLTGSIQGTSTCRSSNDEPSQSAAESSNKNIATASSSWSSQSNYPIEGERPAPMGLGLGGLQPKRRGKPVKPKAKYEASSDTVSLSQNEGSVVRGHQVLQSLVSQSSGRDTANATSSLLPLPQNIGQIMNGIPLGGQNANGQVDMGSMMSQVLQNPAFNRLLSGLSEQAGIGSSADLRNMLEQCTQSPAVKNTLNQLIQPVDGRSPNVGGMLSSLGGGRGGLNLPSMIQQMMPVVSEVLGGGSIHSSPSNGMESNRPGVENAEDANSQVNLHQVVERIEQCDSPASIFRSVLETAARLDSQENNYDLADELGNDLQLASEFIEMLKAQLRARVQKETNSKNQS